jgi:hypothetical protein
MAIPARYNVRGVVEALGKEWEYLGWYSWRRGILEYRVGVPSVHTSFIAGAIVPAAQYGEKSSGEAEVEGTARVLALGQNHSEPVRTVPVWTFLATPRTELEKMLAEAPSLSNATTVARRAFPSLARGETGDGWPGLTLTEFTNLGADDDVRTGLAHAAQHFLRCLSVTQAHEQTWAFNVNADAAIQWPHRLDFRLMIFRVINALCLFGVRSEAETVARAVSHAARIAKADDYLDDIDFWNSAIPPPSHSF